MRLKDLIGNKWRISYDESWFHEVKEVKMPYQIDYEQVKLGGGAGHMRLWDLNTKTFVLWTTRYKLANEIAAEFPEVVIDKMDKEADLYFPLKLVDTILTRFRGARKKQMSEEWKQKQGDRLRAMHEAKKAKKENTP